jgi:hypothetical protein
MFFTANVFVSPTKSNKKIAVKQTVARPQTATTPAAHIDVKQLLKQHHNIVPRDSVLRKSDGLMD